MSTEQTQELLEQLKEARMERVDAERKMLDAKRVLSAAIGTAVQNIYAMDRNPESELVLPGSKSAERERLLYVNALLDELRYDETHAIGKAQTAFNEVEYAYEKINAEYRQLAITLHYLREDRLHLEDL